MTKLSEVTLRLASKVGAVRRGVATSGDNYSLSDTAMIAGMGQSVNGVIWFLSGDALGLSKVITTNPKDELGFANIYGDTINITSISYTLRVVTITAINTLSVGDSVLVSGISTGFSITNIDGTWTTQSGTNATTIKFTVTNQPVGTTPQTISTGTAKKAINIAAGNRYAYVDKETPRDILISAVNAGLRQVDPRLEEDITTLVDSEVDKYTLPTGVKNLIKVEIANCDSAPLYYTQHNHWREVDGELRFDYSYAPVIDDRIIRLTYRADHVDMTEDDDDIPIAVDEEALYWRSLIELLSMLMALRPKKQRYLDLFTEAQTEWQRRAVLPPQRCARLAGW
jgi:hypothetical protein